MMEKSTHIPKLSKFNEGEIRLRVETPEAIRKLLELKQELELDEVSFSGSEISDVFAEQLEGTLLFRKKGEKPLLKRDHDLLIMSQFTDMYKNTAQDVKRELEVGDNLMTENIEDILKILHEEREPKELPPSLREKMKELLEDTHCSLLAPAQLEDAQPSRKPSTADAMSGVWRMLAERDTKGNFRVSSPNFNAFQQDEPHWLERPPIPWQTLDFAKHKCEKWLNEQRS